MPEFQELLNFLAAELRKLDTLEGLEDMTAADRADAVSGRLWASKTLKAMLAPLLGPVNLLPGMNPKEYSVDVDDIAS